MAKRNVKKLTQKELGLLKDDFNNINDFDITAYEASKKLIKLKKFTYKTEAQKIFAQTIDRNILTIAIGPAGCGKSIVPLYKGFEYMFKLENSPYQKIIVTNPLVEVGNKSMGFLPGDITQKTDPFTIASSINIQKFLNDEKDFNFLKDEGILEFKPLNFLRGVTIENAIIILEEAQNTSVEEIKTFITRLGENVRCIISGDLKQSDRYKRYQESGLYDVFHRLNGVEDVETFEFTENDVMRSKIVKDIIKRYEHPLSLYLDNYEQEN